MPPSFDPFRLNERPGPEPVEGPLPPPLRLVEDDEEVLDTAPRWPLRALAAAVVAFFFGTMVFATLGHQPPASLVDGPGPAQP